MGTKRRIGSEAVAAIAAATVLAVAVAVPGRAEHVAGETPLTGAGAHGPRLVMPLMNPVRGKALFVSKGCVACHAINGVGGHDAPAMDAHTRKGLMNPFDFAAKMWNHAPAMIAAQEGAFGEQVYFTGRELADIIAFVYDDGTQHAFSEKDLSARARKMMHHGHGDEPAPKAHAKEIGHHHDAPGTPPHKH
jgi:cytochrome c